jgi:hypothetical protein
MVDRDRSAASSGRTSPKRSGCASRLFPLAWLWFVHSGDAQRMSVRGYRRGSVWEMSAQSWSASGWLLLWVSTARRQWLAAMRTRTPGTWMAPEEEPPAPQNRSVMVRVMRRWPFHW